MPYVKCISGHTSARAVQRYLERGGRALATDFLNIDAPVSGVRDGLEDHGRIDWWREMDRTRAAFGNDAAWNGHRARTWKHYILSPNPEDGIELPRLRRLATAWAKENFGDYEVAIVYHDDNEGRIPHAHVVVNNTNLATGRRIQEPDPRAVKRSVQRLARDMGLSCFEDAPHPAAHGKTRTTRPRRRVHIGRAEREFASKGAYSWVSDIRSRVAIARMVARSEGEFASVLAAMGVTVSENSANAARRDWVYALADHPTRRVGGERLGLSFCRESLEWRFAAGATGRLADATERRFYEVAREALLSTTIDVEHFAKMRLLRMCEEHGEDGYAIVSDYLASISSKQRTRIESALRARGSNGRAHDEYSGDLIAHYAGGYPVWVFLEVIDFGTFADLWRHCASRWDSSEMRSQHYVLKSVRALRNACAHNSLIVNGFSRHSERTSFNPPRPISASLNERGMKNTKARCSKLANLRVSQIG